MTPEAFRRKIAQIVEERGLCSYMNSTKWNELRNAMLHEMPFPPPFIVKFLTEEQAVGAEHFECDVPYQGAWHEAFALEGIAFDGSFAVEWVKIRPRYLKPRGRLLPPELVEAEDIFVSILKKYTIPYEVQNGVYCIYGYR